MFNKYLIVARAAKVTKSNRETLVNITGEDLVEGLFVLGNTVVHNGDYIVDTGFGSYVVLDEYLFEAVNASHLDLMCNIIAKEEGFRAKPYFCSEGVPTIGYGQVVGVKGAPVLPDMIMPEPVAYYWMMYTVKDIVMQLYAQNLIPIDLDDNRKAVLVSMAYQLGLTGLKKFKKMLAAIYNKDYTKASIEALDSRWATQTPARAARHANQLRTGELSTFYQQT